MWGGGVFAWRYSNEAVFSGKAGWDRVCDGFGIFTAFQEERERGEHTLNNISKTQERMQAEQKSLGKGAVGKQASKFFGLFPRNTK